MFDLSMLLESAIIGVIAMSWCPNDSSYLLTCGKDSRTVCWDTISGEVTFGLLLLLLYYFWHISVHNFPIGFLFHLKNLVTVFLFFGGVGRRLPMSCRLGPTGTLICIGILKYLEWYRHLPLMEKLAYTILRYIRLFL